ncbi:methyltransferase domain-containing protein, partial [candidate division KSB1 bacterium]|nr:methyltransferase domain-containing protein [candidate division KSB1 bacterium]
KVGTILRESAQLPREAAVVDLGCGKGAASLVLAAELGYRVTGFDLFEPFLEDAASGARAAGVDHLCSFEVADIRDRAEDIDAFDVAIFAAVGAGLYGDYSDCIAAIRRWTRPNGYIVISDGFLKHLIPPGAKFPGYGKLSGNIHEAELLEAVRVEADPLKRDPRDFTLWKKAEPGRELKWPSPWGDGFPGWHIECSVMATKYLGESFDIHAGGADLIFPHHENEIAQSEGATGKTFVNLWMHNGFVRVDDEKMSKSLNNFFTVREVLKKHKPEEIRFFILASHYRSPLNYALANLDEARSALKGLYTSLRGISISDDVDEDYLTRFNEVMDDDFNTPKAVALLHELAHEINRIKDNEPAGAQEEKAKKLASTLKMLAGILGFLQDSPEEFLKRGVGTDKSGLSDDKIQLLLELREQARKDKDFAEADRIRDLLTSQGITLEDAAEGTIWQRS